MTDDTPRPAEIRIEGSVTLSEGIGGIRLAHLRELVLAAEGLPEDSYVEFPIGGGNWRCPPEVRVTREPGAKPASPSFTRTITVNGRPGMSHEEQAEMLRHSIRRLGGR